MKPAAVRRAAAEADRLIKELNAKPGEGQTPGDEAGTISPAPSPDTAPVASQEPVASPPVPPQSESAAQAPPPPAPPSDDFRQKYDVLRSKYDVEIPTLHSQLAESNDRIRSLEKMLAQLAERQAAPPAAEPEQYVKPEDINEYGKDFFDVVGRRAKEVVSQEVKELRAKVAEFEKKFSETTDKQQVSRRQQVFTLLGQRVPNWQAINSDQRFLAWLAQEDVLSGQQRKELLSKAFEANHAERVVGFFETFLKEDSGANASGTQAQAAPARQPQVPIENLVAPGSTRAPAPAAPGEKRMWTEAEIAQLYAARRRRQVSDEEFKALEKDILAAMMEGRVR